MNNSELSIESLSAAQKGWHRYFIALWIIHFALFTDLLTYRQFLSDEANIQFLNLSVPRIAFSITCGILFGTFIIWATISTNVTRQIICSESDSKTRVDIINSASYRLWFLSPINANGFARFCFWFLAATGMFLLISVTTIHLFGINMPNSTVMTEGAYRGIGIACAAILTTSIYATMKWIIPGWLCIHNSLINKNR